MEDTGALDSSMPGVQDSSVQDSTVQDGSPLDATRPDASAPDTSLPDFDAGSCPPLGSPGVFQPYDTPADGVINGPDVTAHICNLAADVLVNNNGTFFEIGSYMGASTAVFVHPAAGNGMLVEGLLPAGVSPGVYTSADPVNCGSVQFDYGLPVPAGLDCDGGAPPQCPPGCISACSGQGCLPCAPNPPFFGYLASGQTGGICTEVDPQPGTLSGSWAITLTSVVPYAGDAGAQQGTTYYVVHGRFQAQLSGDDGPDGGSAPATLDLVF